MELNIQLFGGRGASSGGNIIQIKNATFTTAVSAYNESGNRQREDIEVKGVVFRHKGIDVGVFNTQQESYPDAYRPGRGGDKYVAVIRTKDKMNGLMIETGKTQKEAVEKSIKLIDERKKDILRAMGRRK